jgi:enoyl-CoA hydratase/carnithine racemase
MYRKVHHDYYICQKILEDFMADEAYRIGFVSRISESDDNLHGTICKIVSKITRNSPVATTVTKLSLNYSRDHSVAEGLQHIAMQNSVALMTDDLVKSFMAGSANADGVDFDPLMLHSQL